MLVDRYLKGLKRGVSKKASPGERVLTSLFPNRGTGWPGGWSQDRSEQVLHMTRWVYVCANLICSKTASIMPNLAYVTDAPKRGVTVKAGRRGLLNLMDRGFGGSTDVGGNYDYRLKSVSNGSAYDYSNDWREVSKAAYPGAVFHPLGPSGGGAEFGFSDGGHSWLTMGEYRSKALSVVKPHDDLEPLESDHPFRRLVENPNPVDTHFDIEFEKRMYRLLTGISYEWTPLNEWGMPCERWCIPSNWVWPRTGGGKYVDPRNEHADEMIQYYEVRPWGGMGSAGILYFPPNEVIVELDKSPVSKIDAWSPLAALAQWIDLDESISKSRWAQMMNVARPELQIKLGPGYEDPDDDRIARLEAKIAAKYQGEYNYGKPLVLPPGAEANPLSYSPTEMAYEKSGDQTQKMILSGFLVPPSAVGLVENMTYGSILATLGALCAFCLNPKLAASGQTQTKHLASRFDERTPAYSTRSGAGGRSGLRRVRLWYDDCVPADPQQVNSDIQADLGGYAITPNEIRALRGRKPYRQGGDDPLGPGPGGVTPIPLNTGDSLEALAQQLQPMADLKQSGGGQDAGGMAGGEGASAEGSDAPASPVNRLSQFDAPEPESAGIEEPNGPPTKGWRVLKSDRKTVAVDLDGTICDYDRWRGDDVFGEVRPGAKESLAELRDRGWRIVVFTVRGNVRRVEEFLDSEGVPYDYVNYNPDQPQGSSGKVAADVYIDDRAVNAKSPWDEILDEVLSADDPPTKYWSNGRTKDKSLVW